METRRRDAPGERRRVGESKQDDAAPPNGGAVNPTYRQTARRDVCLRAETESPLLRELDLVKCRDDRAAEGVRLEVVCTRKGTEGSNPSLSENII